MTWKMTTRFVFIILCLIVTSRAFNLDTEHYTRYGAPGETPAMFGFTVTAHTERRQSWIMVGAPEAQTNQPGVRKGGAVYRCEPMRDNVCGMVDFDVKGDNRDSSSRSLDNKTAQWFGATISSGGEDSPFVACAPRYVSYAGKDRRDPVGTCFVAKNFFTEIIEYAPCRTRNWGYHRQGSCQAGLGAAIAKDGHYLYVGAPGSWYWQGQVYAINPSVRLPFMPPRYKEYGEGQLYSQNLDERLNVLSTGESKSTDDDSYLGYSVVAGYFNGNDEQGVAVGMPRGVDLRGKVVIFTNNLQNIQNITGEQIGAYFGYCLAAGDVDGDGLDDLIVGAPMYTVPNNEGKFETGRIYVIYQNSPEGKYQGYDMRDGVNSRSRFGLSLAYLGDINLDGYGDFAVGAPYDGVNGRGAVYIYHGGINGVQDKPCQIIKAEDVFQGVLNTFGFSVAGGVDLDNNAYNDLIVGAYDSDSVFLFRSKPVVKVMAGIEFTSDFNVNYISLDEKKCTLRSKKTNVTCTNLKYCLIYDGINVESIIDFKIQLILDGKKSLDPRLFFLEDERKNVKNITVPLRKNESYCDDILVYIKDNIRDKLTPLEAELRYSMKYSQSAHPFSTHTRNPRSTLLPILDQSVKNSKIASLNIQKNCGSDNVCIPDLEMTAIANVTKYLLGSKKSLVIEVLIENKGEDAFEASYNLQLPRGIDFVNIERIEDADVPVKCWVTQHKFNSSVKCDIGNPLPHNRLVKFNVVLEPSYKVGMPLVYEFDMVANSTNPENEFNIGNNHKNIVVDIWVETALHVESYSIPSDVLYYNASHYRDGGYQHEIEIGPQVVHLYNFKNLGATVVEKAEIYISWPYETIAGDMLMYVLEQPETAGNVVCERAEHVNDLKVRLDARKQSYVDSNSAALQGHLKGTIDGEKVDSEHGVISQTVSGSRSGGSATGGSTHTYTSSYNYSYVSGGRTLTDEQKKRIDEEENKFSAQSGDASQIHAERAQEAHKHTTSSSQIGNKSGSQSHWSYYNRTSSSEQTGSGGKVTTVTYKYDSNMEKNEGARVHGGQSGNKYFIQKEVSNSKNEDRNIYGSSGGGRSGENINISQGGRGIYHQNVNVGGTQSSSLEKNNITGNVYYSIPKTEYNRTTIITTEERPITHYVWNKTYIIDQDGNTKEIESSTKYYTIGAEDVAGSSFNTRFSGSNNRESSYDATHRGSGSREDYSAGMEGRYNHDSTGENYNTGGSSSRSREHGGSSGYYSGQSSGVQQGGGSTRYGSGTYTMGGSRHYNLDTHQGANYNASQHRDWNEGGESYNIGGRHIISTEETINKDLVNAGSQSFILNHGSGEHVSAGNTYMGTAGNTYLGSVDNSGSLASMVGGKGFRSGALDLGSLQNIDDTKSTSGSSNEHRQQKNVWSGHRGGDSNSYESSSSYNWNSGTIHSDNVQASKPSEHFRWDHQQRVKRQISSDEQSKHDEMNDKDLKNAMQCPGLKCVVMKCVTGPLYDNKDIWISLRSRVNAQTLNKLTTDRQVLLTSVGVIRVLDVQHIGTPLQRPPRAQQAITTIEQTTPPKEAEPVPLWIVLLSAFAGTALLLLLIFALYKLGFFRRHRPETPERQPLNRNGYGHADEQL